MDVSDNRMFSFSMLISSSAEGKEGCALFERFEVQNSRFPSSSAVLFPGPSIKNVLHVASDSPPNTAFSQRESEF